MWNSRPNLATAHALNCPGAFGAELGGAPFFGVKMIFARNPPEKFAGGGDFYAFGD